MHHLFVNAYILLLRLQRKTLWVIWAILMETEDAGEKKRKWPYG
jgi:hypothetical protein